MRHEPAKGKYSLVHNPGYDFLRLLHWMAEANPDDPNLPFAPYLIPTVAILGACCAIEGYINMVGQKVDSGWAEFDKGPVAIKKRIARIYSAVGKHADFSRDIWQQVLDLFEARIELVHPRYVEREEKRDTDIPDLFQLINAKYPPSKSQEIVEAAIDLLLSDTGLTELRDKYRFRTYSGPVRRQVKKDTS